MANQSAQQEPSIDMPRAVEAAVTLDPRLWKIGFMDDGQGGGVERCVEITGESEKFKCALAFNYTLNFLTGATEHIELLVSGGKNDDLFRSEIFRGPEIDAAFLIVRDRYVEHAAASGIGDLKMPTKD
jgi:hypothetical protein